MFTIKNVFWWLKFQEYLRGKNYTKTIIKSKFVLKKICKKNTNKPQKNIFFSKSLLLESINRTY